MWRVKNRLLSKIKVSAGSIWRVVLRPSYFLFAILSALVGSAIMLWSLNIGLPAYIIFELPGNIADKIEFFTAVYVTLYTTNNGIHGASIVVFSVLFGINGSLLLYTLRHYATKRLPKKSNAGALGAAVIGGGCISCGTSIFAPLVGTLGGSSLLLFRDFGAILAFVASGLLLYSIYTLGLIAHQRRKGMLTRI